MDYKKFLDEIESFLNTNTNVDYVNISVSKDSNDVINGSFPVINIEPSGVQFERHPELDYNKFQKVTYKLYFSLGTQNESYETSVLGDDGIKGIIDLIYDFKEALKDFEEAYQYSNNSSGYIIKLNRDKVNIVQRNLKLNESGKFLAIAECEMEFYLTVTLS